ncbi:MAG TPA: amidophosphoribosyltransferase [Methanocorpusculum sp.]|nr:amidophosphoribosyltransferase [Methanocorpusculum sp.]
MSGIAGIIQTEDVSYPLYLCLHALQHRGQETAGIATFDGKKFHIHKNPGQLSEVFSKELLQTMPGTAGVAQVLYSDKSVRGHAENIEPMGFTFKGHSVIITVSASLVNRDELRAECEGNGHIFSSTSNAELIAAILAHKLNSGETPRKAFIHTLHALHGAYTGVAVVDGILYAFRDPLGIKPLCFGKTETGYAVVSESVALDILGSNLIRDVAAGELLIITAENLESVLFAKADHAAHCIFEYVYTARPDSVIDGVLVYDARTRIGACLGKTDAGTDLVSPVPDSGTAFATGYAAESGVPYVEGLLKNRYVGRTFIMPAQSLRENAVRMKLNPVRSHIKDKSIVLVDDSIVRGTTSLHIVDMVKEFGAKEVHMRIGSTPIIAPCYFGVDLPTRKELIATGRTVEEIREAIHATTLEYIDGEDLVEAVGIPKEELCTACAGGEYPLEIPCEKCCKRKITLLDE